MSRSGYSDDCDENALNLWRGAVRSAIKGKRGQTLLRELAAALDAMPVKELIANELESHGEYCALGVVGQARGLDMADLDIEDRDEVAYLFNIAPALAAEIAFENDECAGENIYERREICGPVRPRWPDWGSHIQHVCLPDPRVAERRWTYMRKWVAKNIAEKSQ